MTAGFFSMKHVSGVGFTQCKHFRAQMMGSQSTQKLRHTTANGHARKVPTAAQSTHRRIGEPRVEQGTSATRTPTAAPPTSVELTSGWPKKKTERWLNNLRRKCAATCQDVMMVDSGVYVVSALYIYI